MGRTPDATGLAPAEGASTELSWAGSCLEEAREAVSHELRAVIGPTRASFLWESSIHDRVNYADEDLFLVLRDTDADRVVTEDRISHLNSRSLAVVSDTAYEALLVRKEARSFSCVTSDVATPRIVLLTREPGRFHLGWSGLDWQRIRREVEALHGVDWDRGIEVALHISRWFAEGVLPEEEVVFPGFEDHIELLGQLRQVEMDVVSRDDGRRLKRLFAVQFNARKNLDILDRLAFRTPPSRPRLWLLREIIEAEGFQLRVRWDLDAGDWSEIEEVRLKPFDIPWSSVDLRIRLHDVTAGIDGEEPAPPREATVSSDTWTFSELEPGRCYRAELVLFDRASGRDLGEPVLRSATVWIPETHGAVSLLPCDGLRLLASWSLGPEDRGNKVTRPGRRFLEVRRDPGEGELPELPDDGQDDARQKPDLDVDLGPGKNNPCVLDVWPGRSYRARIVEEHEGRRRTLTPWSAPVSTGRLQPGQEPPTFRSRNRQVEHPSVRPLTSPTGVSDHSLGRLVLHLHAHEPFWPLDLSSAPTGFFGTPSAPCEGEFLVWLESLLPLIDTCRILARDGVDFKLSMDLTPTLTARMRDGRFQEAFLEFVEGRLARLQIEVEHAERHRPGQRRVLRLHLERLLRSRDLLCRENLDLTRPLRRLQEEGHLELLTSAATHALLPVQASRPETLRAQIEAAIQDHEDAFGRRPLGMWLPEGGYAPGLEKALDEAQLLYGIGSAAALQNTPSSPAEGIHAPVLLPGTELVFVPDEGRGLGHWFDQESDHPVDGRYLGSDRRTASLVRDPVEPGGQPGREPYDPRTASEAVASHADQLVARCGSILGQRYEAGRTKPTILLTVPLSTLGHEWFEGTEFFGMLVKKLHFDQSTTELSTLGDVLSRDRSHQEVVLNPASSWSHHSFESFGAKAVSWLLPHLDQATAEMVRMATEAERHTDRSPLENRILAQAGREVLLVQSSDFPRSLASGRHSERMKALFFHHLANFWLLASMYWSLSEGEPADEVVLRELEARQCILPGIDPLLFSAVEGGAGD